MALITQAAWKNTYYTASSSAATYYITVDGERIFAGKAVRYPGASTLQINLDKICRNYLESDITSLLESMPTSSTQLTQPNAQRTFKLYVGSTNVNDYRFYNDYSYDGEKARTGSTINVSKPINGHYFPGMLKLRTYRTSNSSSSTVYTEGSASSSSGLGYTVQVKCAPYVLYYLNSYGGWDAFVIEGNTVKKDAYTTYKTDRVFNNTTLDFEMNKYVQEIKTTYEMNTGYLTDEQAENLAKNLIGSVKVYLHNVEEGWVKPVLINDASVAYQTYQTNGKKLSKYKITVQESQSKIRK